VDYSPMHPPYTPTQALTTPSSQQKSLLLPQRVLGIDPGLERLGYGLLHRPHEDGAHSKQWQAMDWGIIQTHKSGTIPQRLLEIHSDLTDLIHTLQPDWVVVEQLFYFRNATTIIPVAQARGVVLLACAAAGCHLQEATPMQVKQAVTGYGKASKAEVQMAMQQRLNLPCKPTPDDAADALAIALTGLLQAGLA
jgi:crossover junction endodeoxyribonuclease RuvC